MASLPILPWIFLAAALIAGGFLLFTLLHLGQLNIPWYHPRVLVEGTLMLLFLTLTIIGFMSKNTS
jgi:hypothetical protein